MLVQPFLPSVTEEGEYSLMLFGGVFSHAVVKRPKAGDYRVQPHLGGSEQAVRSRPTARSPSPRPRWPPRRATAAYARVDLVRGRDGELKVIELELIEPALWLQHAPRPGQRHSPPRSAAAMRARTATGEAPR